MKILSTRTEIQKLIETENKKFFRTETIEVFTNGKTVHWQDAPTLKHIGSNKANKLEKEFEKLAIDNGKIYTKEDLDGLIYHYGKCCKDDDNFDHKDWILQNL